jgi:hypothetical protein
LGVSALVNPAAADYAEFALLLPEKVEAFGDAGAILVGQSAGIAREMTRFAGDETTLAVHAVLTTRVVTTPASLATEQARHAISWFGRAISQAVTLSTMVLEVQAAAMAPVHRAATDNARRLTAEFVRR